MTRNQLIDSIWKESKRLEGKAASGKSRMMKFEGELADEMLVSEGRTVDLKTMSDRELHKLAGLLGLSSGISREKIDPGAHYTLWQRVGGHWLVERSFPGHYILSTYMDDIEKSWSTSRPYGVFPQGVDPNVRENPAGSKLWRWRPMDRAITGKPGEWELVRSFDDPTNAPGYLELYQKDEPGVAFKLSAGKPRSAPKLSPGMRVTSTYRVDPFYGQELLEVVEARKDRTLVRSAERPGVQGWLDTETLHMKRNPYGSFSPRSQPRTGLTKKGERMVADIESSREYGARTPAVAHATVYARAHERPGTGLVTKRWAAEHGYPRPNPGVDKVAARELQLYIENDGDIYRQHTMPVLRNLSRKWKKGTFNRTLAPKAFSYVVEAGAKKYVKEFDAPGAVWHHVFPKATRDAVAQSMADEFIAEAELGNLYENNPVELETTGYMRSEDLEEDDGPWSVSYGRYENRPHPSRGYDTPVHVISEATGSDYEGGLVYRSNYEAIQEMVDEDDELKPFVVYMYGGHGTYGVAIRLDQGEVPNELLEIVGALSSYPILDEDRHSRMEMEAEDEAWQSYGREEWRDALKDEYPDNEDEIDELSDEELDNLWFSQDLSWNAEHSVEGVTFNFKEAVGNVDFEE